MPCSSQIRRRPAHELGRRHDEPALTLDRLEDDRRDLLGRDLRPERVLERGERGLRVRPAVRARERHAVDLGRERPEPRLVRVRLRGEAERKQRAAVEAAVERDHGRALRVRARELDRVLDRLGAGVEEGDARLAGDRHEVDEALREPDVVLVRDDREVRVREPRRLLLHRLDHPRIRVPDVHAADSAGEVDERVAVDVGDERALSLGDHDRQVDRERVGDHPLLAVEDLLALRARKLGLDADRTCRGHRVRAYRVTSPMVLSDRTIKRLLDEGRIGIDPYDEALLQPSSLDVRVDRFFRVFRNSRYPFIDVKEPMEDLTELVEISDEEQPFILHPGEFVLGSTLERVTLPDDLVARLEGKSSLGRLGLLIHSTAGFIDPGWDGHVTLELSNVANLPITLYVGMPIGQLSFVQLTEPAATPVRRRTLGSKYQGQEGPTPSRYWKNFA